jgi:arginase
MAEAAMLPLAFPEAVVVDCDTLERQTDAIAASLPATPLVLGGCCCAHTGAIKGLAARHGDLAVVWIDAHGDLNTPDTSPSGNAWGMPLRVALDLGLVAPDRVALVGARNLDPPEAAFMADVGLDDDIARALAGATAVYVAVDLDVLDPSVLPVFVPEPLGLSLDELLSRLEAIASSGVPLAGVGLTGLLPTADVAPLDRVVTAAGLAK